MRHKAFKNFLCCFDGIDINTFYFVFNYNKWNARNREFLFYLLCNSATVYCLFSNNHCQINAGENASCNRVSTRALINHNRFFFF